MVKSLRFEPDTSASSFLLVSFVSLGKLSFLFPCPLLLLVFVQSLSHVQLFATPLDCSTPGFPVLYHPPEFVQTHVHRVSDAIQSSHPLLPPSPPAFNLSRHQGLFQ